jgi:hypothetical protein
MTCALPPPPAPVAVLCRARIFKLLRSPRIDSKEPIPPGCVSWRAGTTIWFLKVVGNEKEGGSGRWQMIGIGLRPRRSRFVCLLILAVIFDFVYFRFRQVKHRLFINSSTVYPSRRRAWGWGWGGAPTPSPQFHCKM